VVAFARTAITEETICQTNIINYKTICLP